MSQNARESKYSNDNKPFYVAPTVRLDIMVTMALDQRLKDRDIRLAVVLLSHRNNKSGRLDASQSTIAAELGWSVSKVEKSIARLAETGWVKITHRWYGSGLQRSNQYDFAFEKLGSVKQEDEKADIPSSDRTAQPRDNVRCTPSDRMGAPPSDRTDKPDGEIEPGEIEPVSHTTSDDGVKRADDFFEMDRPSRVRPAWDHDMIEQFLQGLESIYPDFAPFGDIKQPDPERLRRGAFHQLRKLLNIGWYPEEITEAVRAYVSEFERECDGAGSNFEPCPRALAKTLTKMVDDTTHPYGDQDCIPERLRSSRSKAAARNDNNPPPERKAGGDDIDVWI